MIHTFFFCKSFLLTSHQFSSNKASLAHLQLSIKWADTGYPLREVWMERWAAIMLGYIPETEIINIAEDQTSIISKFLMNAIHL